MSPLWGIMWIWVTHCSIRNSVFVLFTQESLLSSYLGLLLSILAQLAVLTYLYRHIMHPRACFLFFIAKQIYQYLAVFLKEYFLFSRCLLASWYLLWGRFHRQHKGHLCGLGGHWERSITWGDHKPHMFMLMSKGPFEGHRRITVGWVCLKSLWFM